MPDVRFLRFSQRLVVWIVAAAVAAESFFQAIQGLLDGRLDHFFLWYVAHLVILGLGLTAEKIKLTPVE